VIIAQEKKNIEESENSVVGKLQFMNNFLFIGIF
jgi:hypothetical protein